MGWAQGRAAFRGRPTGPAPAQLAIAMSTGVGAADEAVLDHGVAAAVLGGVERGVGGLDQVARRSALSVGAPQATPTLTVTRWNTLVRCGIASRFDRGADHFADLQRARPASVSGSSRQNSSPP